MRSKDLAGDLGVHGRFVAAVEEALALGGHDLGLLLPHRAAKQVGAAERVPAQQPADLHHLLLVDDDAVGVLQHRLERRMRIGHLLAAVLSVDEHVDHARGRAAQGGRGRRRRVTSSKQEGLSLTTISVKPDDSI
jgi:hypothetical protein